LIDAHLDANIRIADLATTSMRRVRR